MPEIVREGLILALQEGSQRIYLRHRDGVVIPGCEALVDAFDSGNQFTLDGLPDELAETIKQMVMSADGVRDGDGHANTDAT